jgi:general transcription factor IIIA
LAGEHAPPGTKPYQCDHGDCTKSFSTNQKLRAHLKVHEGMKYLIYSVSVSPAAKENRYTCVNAVCRTAPESAFYPTWTALQHHIRTAHPPTCPHEACAGRTFSSQKGLCAHLKLHEERAVEDIPNDGNSDEEEDALPRKRRRGGEIGRDWKCEVEGCGKDFKSVWFWSHSSLWLFLMPLIETGSHNAPCDHSSRPA